MSSNVIPWTHPCLNLTMWFKSLITLIPTTQWKYIDMNIAIIKCLHFLYMIWTIHNTYQITDCVITRFDHIQLLHMKIYISDDDFKYQNTRYHPYKWSNVCLSSVFGRKWPCYNNTALKSPRDQVKKINITTKNVSSCMTFLIHDKALSLSGSVLPEHAI